MNKLDHSLKDCKSKALTNFSLALCYKRDMIK